MHRKYAENSGNGRNVHGQRPRKRRRDVEPGRDRRARFTISTSGELAFRASKDYEKPNDGNKDNIYEVTVRASDGNLMPTLDVLVTVTNVDEPETDADAEATVTNVNEALIISGLASINTQKTAREQWPRTRPATQKAAP